MNAGASDLIFHKYSALGNHFCVVDELKGLLMDERERLLFAQEFSSIEFGIGCDSMLFVQAPGPEAFEGIRRRFGRTWEAHGTGEVARALILENRSGADALMRVIEPCGQESAMCGNGIRCVADHLFRAMGLERVRILAEVGTALPRIYEVERCGPSGYRVRMPVPQALPGQFKGSRFDALARDLEQGAQLLDVPIPERLSKTTGTRTLRCIVTYTGEPHLVSFTAACERARERLGLPPGQLRDFYARSEAYRNAALCALGDYLNDRGGAVAPCGIVDPGQGTNVSVVEPQGNGTVSMRVYERGIWRQTKACGTGATAAGFLALRLGLVDTDSVKVLSAGSFYINHGSAYMPGYVRQCGTMVVLEKNGSWYLQGPAELIYSGRLENWREKLLSRGDDMDTYSCKHLTGNELTNDRQHGRELVL